MIRHLLATTVAGAIAGVRRAAGDPFIIAGLGLILAGSGMQGVVDRLITVRDEVTTALEQLAELPQPEPVEPPADGPAPAETPAEP